MNTTETPKAPRAHAAAATALGIVALTVLVGCQGAPAPDVDESSDHPAVARPAYVQPATPADRAEAIIDARRQNHRAIIERLPGATADRLDRALRETTEGADLDGAPVSPMTADRIDRERD